MHLFFLLCLASVVAHAGFGVKPTIITMNVSRGELNGWLEIAHTRGNTPHAIELAVNERELDLEGHVKNNPAPVKDFVIIPSQIMLLPGKSTNVQVIYKGPKLQADKAYILHVKELPLPEGQKDAILSMGLAVRVNYNVGILMDMGKPSALTFVSSKTLDSGKVEVIMENKSNGRFSLANMNIYANGNKVVSFPGEINSVMPGQQRRFVFEYNKPLTAQEIRFGK